MTASFVAASRRGFLVAAMIMAGATPAFAQQTKTAPDTTKKPAAITEPATRPPHRKTETPDTRTRTTT
jgi:hypothetical protein